MFFSSLPSYLDPPNWSQQQQVGAFGGGGGGNHEINSQLPSPLMPPPPPLGGGGDGRSIQMSEHGRITKLPQQDTAMKCPRCESTNTKFCYFNNYSLSQPRHFCKTCRRYWTRGGALRRVPVGGGFRTNKKTSKGSRGSRSKSPLATTSSTSNIPISPNSCTTDVLGHLAHNTRPPQFPILPPLHHYVAGDFGVTFRGGSTGSDMMNLGHESNYPSCKLSHFPFLEGSNRSGVYGKGPSIYGGQDGGMNMEANNHNQQQQNHGMILSRNFLGISGNDQCLGTSNVAWSTTDLSGFTSSSSATTTATTISSDLHCFPIFPF